MTEVTYNEFRGLHKGTPQKKVSKLWKKYKDGKYKLPKQVTPAEEITVPVGVVEVNIKPGADESYGTEDDKVVIRKVGTANKASPKTPTKKSPKSTDSATTVLEKCSEYERLYNTLDRFSFKFDAVETKKVLERISELAKETRPEGYVCEPTDSWKIWFGPTEQCLLINTTRGVAFKVSRGWWQKHYQTTIYVDRELLNNNILIDDTAKAFALAGKYLPRSPVVGVECKLPQTVKDIHMRGGHAGDR